MSDLITKVEKDAGLVAHDEKRVAKFKTVDELMADWGENPSEYTGVSYDDRIKFLKANGYDVTRENLLTDLSVRSKKKK
jgi:hypothetical protein